MSPTDPLGEALGYPGSHDITTVVIPDMAHMHNVAETRGSAVGPLPQVAPGRGSLGRPNTVSAMMLRCTSELPA